MTRFMMSTATAIVLAGTAYAQDGAFIQYEFDPAADLYASDLIGTRIYGTEGEVSGPIESGATSDWDDLGEINDVIMNREGELQAAILGVGGFLGIGERNVAVSPDAIQFVQEGEDPGNFVLVVNATEDQVENAPEFQRGEDQDSQNAEGEGGGQDGGTQEETSTTGGMDNGQQGGGQDQPDDSQDQAAEVEGGGDGTEDRPEPGEDMTDRPAEEAAEQVEQAAEDAAGEAGQAAEDAGQAAEGAAEDAEQAAEGAAEDAEQAAEGAAQEAEQATEDAEQAAEGAAQEAEQATEDAEAAAEGETQTDN